MFDEVRAELRSEIAKVHISIEDQRQNIKHADGMLERMMADDQKNQKIVESKNEAAIQELTEALRAQDKRFTEGLRNEQEQRKTSTIEF